MDMTFRLFNMREMVFHESAFHEKFSVPRFAILTVQAYSLFAEQREIKEATRALVEGISADGDIKELCLECAKTISAACLPDQLLAEVNWKVRCGLPGASTFNSFFLEFPSWSQL